MADESVEVAALSWILELPRDLGLEEGSGPQLANERNELAGWEGSYNLLPDWSEGPPNAVPRRRLRFRRALVEIGMPTAATDLTFGHLRRLEGERRREWEEGIRERIAEGAKEWKTVCQMTRWYVGDAIPDPPEDPLDSPADWVIRADFAPMLGELDIWLQAYGMAAGQAEIGPLVLHDLPAMGPWVLDTSAGPGGPRSTGSGMLPIHGRVPNLAPAEGSVGAGQAASLLIARGTEAFPSFGPLSLLFQAQRHALAGRGRQVTINVGTAVESLVTVVVREAMRLRGRSDGDVREVLDAKWTAIYNRTLLETLSVEVGAGGAAHSKWWAEAYKLRNDDVPRRRGAHEFRSRAGGEEFLEPLRVDRRAAARSGGLGRARECARSSAAARGRQHRRLRTERRQSERSPQDGRIV